jgi:anaerobic selenocysteine-containing dehydrogenase
MERTCFVTCNLCEAMCGLAVTVEGEEIVSIRGDDEDAFSRGHICPKAVALKDVHTDPDRLRLPQKRSGSTWETISWNQAFDEVEKGLKAIQKKYGRHCVAIYQGNPTVHNIGCMTHGQLFVRALRTRQRYSATSLDQLPHMLAGLMMFGHQLLLPIPDVDRTDFFLVLGANPVASNGSIMTAPGIARRLKELRARGGKLVVVDPRRTETAEIADRHVFIRPGTDALLLASLIRQIAKQGARLGRLAAFTDGLDAIVRAVDPFTPEAIAGPTGIDPEVVKELARDLLAARTAACYGRVGVSTQEFGGLCAWLLNVLNIVSGNIDRPGGMMFTRPAIDAVEIAARFGETGTFGRYKSRVRGLPEFGGELPAAVLAEEIDTPGEGQVKALVTSAGNPVLSSPNGNRLERALASLELMVSIDIYRNETTRHAHYILPPTFGLEHANYDLAFHLLAVRNTAKYSPAVFDRPKDARHDWEIYLELALRMRSSRAASSLLSPLRKLLSPALPPERILDFALRTGPFGGGFSPFNQGLTLERLKSEVHGIDLGPLEASLPERLYTESKRIVLAPQIFLDDIARLERKLSDRSSNGELHLIGRRDLRTNNSWMHNSERLVKGADRCTVLMHPLDAEQHALTNGQQVELRSGVGSVVARLEISDEVMRGVVSLPHGWGHARSGVQLRIAEKHPGVSINDLTDEGRLDLLSGSVAFSGVPVTVHAVRPNA